MVDKGTRATPANRGAEAAARYRGERQGSSGAGGRPRHVLEVEDVLLAAWVLGSESLVRHWLGEPSNLAHTLMANFGDGWIAWLRGLPLVGWVVVALFLFILLTRGPQDTDRDVALSRRWPMLTVALPLLSIYALIATGVQKLIFGLPQPAAGEQPPWPGPYVPGVVRRTVAIPLALLGDAVFRHEFPFAEAAAQSAWGQSEPLLPLLLGIVLSAPSFAMLVAGPRIAAGDTLAWRPWILRFLLFYGSVFISLVTNW